jgi:hypothetical protein
MSVSNTKNKKKAIIWIVSTAAAIALFVGVIIWSIPARDTTVLTEKELNRIISEINQGGYNIENQVKGLAGMEEDDKEQFIYDLDRLLLHLETDFHKEAEVSKRIDRLKEIESTLDFPFCNSFPEILVTLDGGVEQKTISFREYSELTKISSNTRYYLLNASAKRNQNNSHCIDKIHIYAK